MNIDIEYELQNHFKVISKENKNYKVMCKDTEKSLEINTGSIFRYKSIKYICPHCGKEIHFQSHIDKCNKMFKELAKEIYIEQKYKGRERTLKKMALKHYHKALGFSEPLDIILDKLGYINILSPKDEFIELAKDIYINNKYEKGSKVRAAKYMKLKNLYNKLQPSDKSLHDYLVENNLKNESKNRSKRRDYKNGYQKKS